MGETTILLQTSTNLCRGIVKNFHFSTMYRQSNLNLELVLRDKRRKSFFGLCIVDINKVTRMNHLLPNHNNVFINVICVVHRKWLEEIALANKKGRKPSLLRAMTKTFWMSYAPSGIMFLIQALFLK